VLGKVVVHMLAAGDKPARLDGEVGDDAGATGLLGGLDDHGLLAGQRVPDDIAHAHRQDPAVAPSIVRRSSLASLTSDGRGRPVPEPFADLSTLLRMARTGGAKVQLCGRLVVKLGAQRAEEARHDTMFAGDCS
jgi:hypothetical protein